MPKTYKPTSTNEHHQNNANKKLKDKPTYKIIVLGCGGVGKVSKIYSSSYKIFFYIYIHTYIHT